MTENFECEVRDDFISVKCKKCNEEIAVFGSVGSTKEIEKEKVEHSRVCLDQILNTQSQF